MRKVFDLYRSLEAIRGYFGIGRLPTNHFIYSEINSQVPGKFKDELQRSHLGGSFFSLSNMHSENS